MIKTITNGTLTVSADTHGAELHSFVLNATEYLWQSGKAWKRYAPILFPFICSPEGKTYRAGGKEYKMPSNHGFARDSDFKLAACDDRSMTFTLVASDATKLVYPYEFLLTVKYELTASDTLTETVTVKNTDSKEIYFYLGGHPAFNCPLDGGSFDDCYVEYSKPETLIQNWNGVRTILNNETCLHLTRQLFDNDVIMKDDPASASVALRSLCSDKGVTLSWDKGVSCISVWSPAGDNSAEFVCLEPWSSVPVYADDNQPDIEKKAHAICLESGEEFVQRFRIRGF